MTTRLLLSCAAIAVAGGLVAAANAYLFNLLLAAAPMLLGLAAAGYFLPGVLALACFRRGGVGLVTSLIAGLVQAPFVPTGIVSVSVFVIIGIAIELPFLLTRYRIWRAWLFYVMALWVSAFYSAYWFVAYDLVRTAVVMQVVLPIVLTLTLLAATWFARFLAVRLTRTGVFRGLQRPEVRPRRIRADDAATD